VGVIEGYTDCMARGYAPNEHIDALSVSGDDLFDLVGGTRTLPGEWLPEGDPVALTIEIQEIDEATQVNCESADFATVAHVFTNDGSVDATATNLHYEIQGPLKLELEVADFPRALPPGSDSDAPPKLSIELARDIFGPGGADASAVLSAGTAVTIGEWSSEPWTLPKPVPSLYEPPVFMASACANAPAYSGQAPLEYTPLDSADEARSMAIGTWVYCQQPTVTGSVGFRVAGDGSVRDLILDGDKVVVRGGFGHESTLSVFDTSAMNELPGLYQIGAGNFAGYFWQGALASSDSMYGTDLLLATDETFEDVPNSFDSMVRAGAQACGTAEAGIVSVADAGELGHLLAGSWTRCSGSLPNGAENFTFDANNDTLTFQDGNGQTIDESSCDLGLNAFGSYHQLDCPDFKRSGTWASWDVEFATRPLEVLLTNGARTAVFSALP
jgi:hypothetical protein